MVSVIIPDCNDGIYMTRCVNSIKRQTYKDIEILAVWTEGDAAKEIEGVNKISSDPGIKNVV